MNKKFMSKSDVSDSYDPEHIYNSLKEVVDNRPECRFSGAVEVELDSYGNLSITEEYTADQINLILRVIH